MFSISNIDMLNLSQKWTRTSSKRTVFYFHMEKVVTLPQGLEQ